MNDELRERLISKCEEDGDFVTDVDGFVKFWPTANRGCYEAHHLRYIADELDRRNAPWLASLNAYFDAAEHGTELSDAPADVVMGR